MPWMMLKPDTLAVIDPREMAASADVDIWPMDTTETTTREYSRTCVLDGVRIEKNYFILQDGRTQRPAKRTLRG